MVGHTLEPELDSHVSSPYKQQAHVDIASQCEILKQILECSASCTLTMKVSVRCFIISVGIPRVDPPKCTQCVVFTGSIGSIVST